MENQQAGSLEKNFYLQRYAEADQELTTHVLSNTGIAVVIPVFNEPSIISVLESLLLSYQNYSDSDNSDILIIIVINHSELADESIKETNAVCYEETNNWYNSLEGDKFQLAIVCKELRPKNAGVGLARKIGMDEAVRAFEQHDTDGLIINLDADCRVSTNYFTVISNHFKNHPDSPAASIFFEHPELAEDIIHYELFLRYFTNVQRYSLLPFAYQTVGSAMVVRSRAYQKQGGMNKKKAGEDFYFLQKMMLLGNFSEVNEVTVYPSARKSDRVPFGTGKAMIAWEGHKTKEYLTYHPETFVILKRFIEILPELYINELNSLKDLIPIPIWNFLEENGFRKILLDVKSRSGNFKTFQKQFYTWFDGFRLMKFVHYSRDNFYPNAPLEYGVKWLFENYIFQRTPQTLGAMLLALRDFDRKGYILKS